jgi:hypothetical protein
MTTEHPGALSVNSVFFDPAAPSRPEAFAWVLRMIVEDPQDPRSALFRRQWVDCAISARAVGALASAIPDWLAETRRERRSPPSGDPLAKIKLDWIAIELAQLAAGWLGGQALRVQHSGSLSHNRLVRQYGDPGAYAGLMSVSAAPNRDLVCTEQSEFAGFAFARWARANLLPGHWAVWQGDVAQLDWDRSFTASSLESGAKQMRFWNPHVTDGRFSSLVLGQLEKALLAHEASLAASPDSDRAARLSPRL